MSAAKALLRGVAAVAMLLVSLFFLRSAYDIRLFAIRSYGLVIHEFDPWFNFRATQYLADHGWTEFFHWYDYMSWYPLGRPIGTTIYPGMQIMSVFLWNTLKAIGLPMKLNDVCCYVPAWFGSVATGILGLLTVECSGSYLSGVVATGAMAVIPAHIMRSVGGGYDNESVAMTAMLLTFYCWNRSIRSHAVPFGILCGLAYTFMVATWGGYIFVLNMIGVHAAFLVLRGNFTVERWKAYSLFYVIGTFGATRVPVVGMAPLKSLEQLGPAAVFLGYQLLMLCLWYSNKKKHNFYQQWQFRVQVFSVAALAASVVIAMLWPTGYFGPLSSRVRGLFVKHTRTGNPLVDSVAEHQPANEQAYRTYLHDTYWIAPVGFAISSMNLLRPSSHFLMLWAITVLFFANKMMRLILLTGPVASALTGIAIGIPVEWAMNQLLNLSAPASTSDAGDAKGKQDTQGKANKTGNSSTPGKQKKNKAPAQLLKNKGKAPAGSRGAFEEDPFEKVHTILVSSMEKCSSVCEGNSAIKSTFRLVSLGIIMVVLYLFHTNGREFWQYSYHMAQQLSSPSIMFHAQLRDGTQVTVDDYREAYWWLRDNTPEDSRVMAWWDYGYQIAGIANRTTIADGNTWNHEHIATLGRCLTSPEKEAHRIVRHLADYILVWTGGGGDDLAKSPHMARIGNSVFSDICPGDPTCSQFGFYQGGVPTPMMEESLLYKLHSHLLRPGVQVDPNRFREVYRSKFGKVRIYQVLKVDQKSKAWVADPTNRLCDAPGSWYCVGQYPPALHKLIARRKNFAQLEDFNSGGGDSEYVKEYMERMSGKKSGGGKAGYGVDKQKKSKTGSESAEEPAPEKKLKKRSKKWAQSVVWENTEETTTMYSLIETNNLQALDQWLASDPDLVHLRSEDGRGPLWWANEFKRGGVVELLRKYKVREDLVDSQGKLPSDLN